MKRIMTIVLVLALVFGLCACGNSGENKSATLEVGYAKEKIMPDQAVPLAGYGKTERRLTSNFLDYLYATCIAFKWGDEIVLWYTQDLISSAWYNEARAAITAKTGVPGDRIMVCATHTHSAPDQRSNLPGIGAYKTIYTTAMATAAANAIADLAPGKLYGTSTTANLNFIRHYKLSDGTYGGDNFGDFSKGIVDHAAKNDPEMQLLKVEREGDKQDILVMNWQAHPCKTGGGTKTDISADFIGGIRDAVESQTDYLFAYFTGAAGNHNTSSRIEGEEKTMDKNQFGQEMWRIAQEALPNLQPIVGEGIKLTQVMYEADVNHDDEHLAMQARLVLDEWDKNGGDTAAAAKFARTLGLSSVYHASAIVNRPGRPQRASMEICAANIAGFAFVTAPIEMFAATGMYIKENSPNEITFVCSCANGAKSYIPTADAYDYGCYESFTSYFAKGTAELLQVEYVNMLKGLQ